MTAQNKIMVSVMCMAYNQEKYITDCLEGFVNQQTDFKFEVIIHDDASTDKTAEIIRHYAEQYPEIIKPIFQKENQYRQNIAIGKNFIYPQIRGKYLANCDGDDYWSDPHKLQKQVDFMESHPDYAMCFHPMKMIYIEEDLPPVILPKIKKPNPQSYEQLLRGNYIPSNAIMYRYEYIKKSYPDYPADLYPGDWFRHLNAGLYGKIGYLKDVMSVYRRNRQGISYTDSENPTEDIHHRYGLEEMTFFKGILDRVQEKYPWYYSKIFCPQLKEIILTYVKYNEPEKLRTLQERYAFAISDIPTTNTVPSNSKYKKLKKRLKFSLYLNILLGISLLCFALL